ncbi:MAG: hypothetical protein HOB40_09210 [Candidatus Marinimicrobia bacterium]|jgi:uncharacterized membrane protein|nr:hypothetical protein [Candidatus Neomarinimicrobiota bacterium]MBT3839792.1 hypothetical protein [Candidatus Neomarinimicrobiota bacterium]MBT3999557.1 hypothetical protein [Candidatus Neomarinimicrobiota bacterium]MBT4283388.1 hypothetical protein [Candidatus Neomarinimicrobiota bacterium]MBT4578923.1 hypothetical protein [Candidatus Neomarinimicrobiota bacterium]
MDWLTILVLWIHILFVVVWLGSDFVVFSLSWSLMNRDLPIDVRLDRAKLAQKFDMWVTKVFLATPVIGLVLAWLRWRSFSPLITLPWMNYKLILFGVILIMAIILITGAAGTVGVLQDIKDGKGDEESNEALLAKRVKELAYPAITLHILLALIIIIALVGSRMGAPMMEGGW